MNLNDYPKTVASLNKFLRERGFTVKVIRAPGDFFVFVDADENSIESVAAFLETTVRGKPYRLWLEDAEEAELASAEAALKRRKETDLFDDPGFVFTRRRGR